MPGWHFKPGIQPPLTAAFPSALLSEVEAVIKNLPLVDIMPMGEIGPILLNKERIIIPHRIYHSELDNVSLLQLDSRQHIILSCLYTRHHNGYVREKHLKNIIRCNEIWVFPFIFALIGEYVIEILQFIYNYLSSLDKDSLRLFTTENEEFLDLTRQRIISYWYAYFYREYFPFKNHIGYKILSELSLWNSIYGKRLLPHVPKSL